MFSCWYLLLIVASVNCKGNKIKDLKVINEKIVEHITSYADELQQKCDAINDALDEYSEEIKAVDGNAEQFLSNPLYGFKLIRQMHKDVPAWLEYLEAPVGDKHLIALQELMEDVNLNSVFKLASKEIYAIFKFYNFKPNDYLPPRYELRLSAADCYYVGVQLYEAEAYHDAAEWLMAAASEYSSIPAREMLTVPAWRVLEMQSKVFIHLNKWEEAKAAIDLAIDQSPMTMALFLQRDQLAVHPNRRNKKPVPAPAYKPTNLQLQCQGHLKPNQELICENMKSSTSFLELAPLRLEEILMSPYVLLYHDVIYEDEIEDIRVAFVLCKDKLDLPEGMRGCLIPDNHSASTKKVAVRTLDMTGLDTHVPGLYVIEYGPRELFKIIETLKAKDMAKDVEASVIIFMNDVAAGGAYTNSEGDFSVIPHRGDALVTFNEGDFEQYVCPNLLGTGFVIVKFVATEE